MTICTRSVRVHGFSGFFSSLLYGCFLAVGLIRPASSSASDYPEMGRALLEASEALAQTADQLGDPYVYPLNTSTPAGFTWSTRGISHWTSGFFPGALWHLYAATELEAWSTEAAARTEPIEPIKNFTSTHDVGFQIFCSFGQGYLATENDAYRPIILTAAASLASRYSPNVRMIKSWDWWSSNDLIFPVIADNMMNLELLMWASEQPGGLAEWRTIAENHADRTIEEFLRPDFGSWHVIEFLRINGAVLKKTTHQGFADDSTWARGQAWLVYGFTMMYRYTGKASYLQAAQDTADFFLDRLPADRVPYWDFDVTVTGSTPRDSSAAAIVASALLELSTYVDSEALADHYWNQSLVILGSLVESPYWGRASGANAVLLQGCYNYPSNNGRNAGLVWGEYYLMEALLRYFRLTGSGTYPIWRDGWFAESGLPESDWRPLANPDGDNLRNIDEYVRGSNPLVADGTELLAVEREGNEIILQYAAPKNAIDAVVTLEATDSPASPVWTDVTSAAVELGDPELFSDRTVREMRMSLPSTPSRQFYRLKIELLPLETLITPPPSS